MDVTTALSKAAAVYSRRSSLEGTCISLYDGSDFIKGQRCGVSAIKRCFFLRTRKFRLRDARTCFIHLELIRYKIDGL